MITINHNEAVLFRILVGFFGEDRVVPNMSLMAVCGGELPSNVQRGVLSEIEKSSRLLAQQWASQSKCLFTIVNEQDDARLVIEFVPNFDGSVDVKQMERQRLTRPMLQAAGIPYLLMSQDEFSDITSPGSGFDFVAFLESRIGASDEQEA